jgi:hypothetical protein
MLMVLNDYSRPAVKNPDDTGNFQNLFIFFPKKSIVLSLLGNIWFFFENVAKKLFS